MDELIAAVEEIDPAAAETKKRLINGLTRWLMLLDLSTGYRRTTNLTPNAKVSGVPPQD